MYICVCKAVTDKEIEKIIDEEQLTYKELIKRLNIANQCGRCNKEIKILIDNKKVINDRS
jgi:bacterioferritin-associated ferredoxin